MEWVAAVLFVTVIAVLLAGFPVAFTLAGTALIFADDCEESKADPRRGKP